MIFQKPSLRTRVSFDMAMRHVGGDALYLSPSEIGLGQRESVADVCRVLSSYVEAIMASVFAHEHILELASYSRVPVINGLSDHDHPCQAMADLLTLKEHFSNLQGIDPGLHRGRQQRGRFVASRMRQTRDGFFDRLAERLFAFGGGGRTECQKDADAHGSRIRMLRDPAQAAEGADVLYTDAWVSMGQEDETLQREKAFDGYQINTSLLRRAKPEAVVLHCLPAHRGKEITDEVADGPRSLIFPQAENRLHAQKAVLVHLLAPEA